MKLVMVPTTRSPPCMAFRSSVPFIVPYPPLYRSSAATSIGAARSPLARIRDDLPGQAIEQARRAARSPERDARRGEAARRVVEDDRLPALRRLQPLQHDQHVVVGLRDRTDDRRAMHDRIIEVDVLVVVAAVALHQF